MKIKFLMVLILLAIGAGTAAGGYQLITHTPNFDMESWTSGTSGVAPDGWSLAANASQTGGISRYENPDGTYALQIEGNNSTTYDGHIGYECWANDETIYNNKIGINISAENISGDAVLEIYMYDGSAEYYYQISGVGNQTLMVDGEAYSGYHYYEFDTGADSAVWGAYVDIYTVGLNDSEFFRINDIELYSDNGAATTETRSNNSLSHNFSYTPQENYSYAWMKTEYENYSLLFLPVNNTTVSIDCSNPDTIIKNNNIFFNTSELDVTAHNVNISSNFSENVMWPNSTSQFDWCNYTWYSRSEWGGPNMNSWNVDGSWIDSEGKLHVTVQNVKNAVADDWQCSEVAADDKLYGTFSWVVESPVFDLDKNLVFAMFTYHDDVNENDIEVSTWSGGYLENLWYTIQPSSGEGNLDGSYIPETVPGEPLNFTIDWQPTSVQFSVRYLNGSEIDSWTCTNQSSISAMPNGIAIQAWLTGEERYPSDGMEREFVLDSFSYTAWMGYPASITVDTIAVSTDSSAISLVEGGQSGLYDLYSGVTSIVSDGYSLATLSIITLAAAAILRMLGYI